MAAAAALLLTHCAPKRAPDGPGLVAPRTVEALPSAADDLAKSIDDGDLELALSALCRAYAEGGMPCPETLYLERLAPDDVMARASSLGFISMTPLPSAGQGLAYLDNWSRILSEGQ